MWAELKRRIGPFVALLDARYLPLLFAVAPQAYAVFDWLIKSGAPEWVAILGGVGFEMTYVGAIAWAEDGRSSVWTWITAVVSLAFSVGVAVAVYAPQGWAAWLHAGFPLVAFCYTLQMHTATKRPKVASEVAEVAIEAPPVAPRPALVDSRPATGKLPDATTLREKVAEMGTKAAVAAHYGVSRQAVDKKLQTA